MIACLGTAPTSAGRVTVMIPMELIGVQFEVAAQNPMMLLREQTGAGRILPIYIGQPEATAIELAVRGVIPPRPLTHDLLVDTIQALGRTLVRVVVTALQDHTFYAEAVLEGAGGDTVVVSCRPSDTVALAARTSCPIFAAEAVLDEAASVPPSTDEEPEDVEELVDEFREFMDHVNPEDFAS